MWVTLTANEERCGFVINYESASAGSIFSIFVVNGCYPRRLESHVRHTSRQSNQASTFNSLCPYSVPCTRADGFYGVGSIKTRSCFYLGYVRTLHANTWNDSQALSRTRLYRLAFYQRILIIISQWKISPIFPLELNISKNFSISGTDTF